VTTPNPLPPEVDALLRAARPLDAAPQDARERLGRRIDLSVAAPVVAAVAGTAASQASRGAAHDVHDVRDVHETWRRMLSPFSQKIVIGVASFALGGGVGAVTHAAVAPAPSVVRAATPATSPPDEKALAPTPLPAAAAPANVPPVVPTFVVEDLPATASAPAVAARPAALPSPSGSPNERPNERTAGLADERRLLDNARGALSRGEPTTAMAPLDEHAKRFPHGILAEEREALAIQALARSGRSREAEERAARFQKAFPTSLMMPAVKDALGAARDRP
jgi:hypothetical protein